MPVDYEKLENMPDFLTGTNLIEIGAYISREQLYVFRRLGNVPPSVGIGKKKRYPKDGVIKFLSPQV